MIEISKLIHKGISQEESFEKVLSYLSHGSEGNFLLTERLYKEFYDNKTPKEVLIYIKKNKFYRRKKQWANKAIDGLKSYKNNNALNEKGLSRHLVEKYIMMKDYENQKGQMAFEKMFKEKDCEKAIDSYLKELTNWRDHRTSLICEYPFFTELTNNQQSSALEVDLLVIIGEWLVTNLEHLEIKGLQDGKIMVDTSNLNESEDFVERAPSTSLNQPYWGVSKKEMAALGNEHSIGAESLITVKRKKSFEMSNEFDLFLDSNILQSYQSINEIKNVNSLEIVEKSANNELIKSYTKKIRTPDMADWRLFVYLINRRHKNFQQNRRIQVYFSDIIAENEKTDGRNTYQIITDRLLRLGFYRMAKNMDGKIHISSLFSDMIIDKDEKNKWFVTAVVSDSVYDDVIKQQTINIYNKKVQELQNDFAYHLVFVLQKARITSYKKESEDITITMEWEDFSSIRFNKRTKKENFDEIELALKEIKEMGFLVKDYKRIANSAFIISTYPLNLYELEDMNSMKLTYPVPEDTIRIEQDNQ